MTDRLRLLVVEDDPDQREQLVGFLGTLDVETALAADVPSAQRALDEAPRDVVLTDLRLPGGDGLGLLRWARTRHPTTDFLVMTAYASVDDAVEAMRLGAHDFLTKPLNLDVLEQRLARLRERRLLDRELRGLRERLSDAAPPADVVAESPAARKLLELVRRVAPSDATVLVTGETGSGKEVVARLVHEWSRRRDGPFVRVNCAAIPESLLESELFGHVRGAFTGADRDRTGLFVEAHGGTLLLDEIGEVAPSVQVRLLRVLQEREVVPVGATQPRKVDVRVVAATNRDLEADVASGRFRQDLLFRLAVLTVAVPPLRERREDLETMIPRFVARYARESGVPPPRVSPEAFDALLRHAWPGNVRELQNVLQRAVVLASGAVRLDDLPSSLRGAEATPEPVAQPAGRTLPERVEAMERSAILQALAENSGVKTRAARALGIPERVLRYKLDLYGLETTKTSNPRQDRRSSEPGGA